MLFRAERSDRECHFLRSACVDNYVGVKLSIHNPRREESVDFIETSAYIQRKHYSLKPPINFRRIPFGDEKKPGRSRVFYLLINAGMLIDQPATLRL